MDVWLFYWLNDMAGNVPALDLVMKAVAESMIPLLLVLAGLLWFWPGKGRRGRRLAVALGLPALLLVCGLVQLPQMFFYRARPYMELRMNLIVTGYPGPSFPASHVAAIAALAPVLGRPVRGLGLSLWLLTAANMVARVYIGVHYPSDVAVGALLGGLAGWLVQRNRDVLLPLARRLVAKVERLLPF